MPDQFLFLTTWLLIGSGSIIIFTILSGIIRLVLAVGAPKIYIRDWREIFAGSKIEKVSADFSYAQSG
jgi:hypothetical protein